MAKSTDTVSSGRRVQFTEGDQVLPIPNLTEHQTKSWKEFVDYGLGEVFAELNPIKDYTEKKMSLRFKDYSFKDPIEDERTAKDNLATYEAALEVNVEIENLETGEKTEKPIFFGNFPWMTDRASFIINGTERVIVSQLIRSAGVYFQADTVAGHNYYGAKIIPGRGAWLEFETDTKGVRNCLHLQGCRQWRH